jgi:tripartite-type tricarboxylate transporter receptor subunit TctC
LITAEVGGMNDFAARLIAQGLSTAAGQQFIVENRPGGNGALAAQSVAKAPADGYTLLLYSGVLWVGPLLQDLPWDVFRDFVPITKAVATPNVLVVHPSLPVRTVKELITLAKDRPGQLNYASASIGSSTHLAAALFNALAGVDIVRINYKGGGGALNAVIAGQIHMIFITVGLVKPHLESGRLRALGISSLQPSPLAPALPPIAASGVPGYESMSVHGVFGPAKLPPAQVQWLNQQIVQVLNRPDVKIKFFNAGVEVVPTTPDEFAASIKAEVGRMGKVLKEAGIRAQ